MNIMRMINKACDTGNTYTTNKNLYFNTSKGFFLDDDTKVDFTVMPIIESGYYDGWNLISQISEEAYFILKLLSKYAWIARDKKTGAIWAYLNKPVRKDDMFILKSDDFKGTHDWENIIIPMAFENYFPMVTWENSPMVISALMAEYEVSNKNYIEKEADPFDGLEYKSLMEMMNHANQDNETYKTVCGTFEYSHIDGFTINKRDKTNYLTRKEIWEIPFDSKWVKVKLCLNRR